MRVTRRPSLDAIREAAERIREVVVHTPLLKPKGEAGDVLLKPETLQAVGSFKLRGVFNAVAAMPGERRARGLSTVSAGNTAQALAWSGRHFGVPARSLMPETAPATKIAAVRRLGGTPDLVPVPELFRYLRERGWESEPYAFVHPWTDPDVMTGHGSLGLEILADCPELDSVFAAVGGGGLIAGLASALKASKPGVRVFGVEPEGCASLRASFDAGHPAAVDCHTLSDGVAVPYITEEMYPLLRELVDDVVCVSEQETRAAIRRLALEEKLVVEGAGALSLAAALRVPRERRGRSVCVLTGGSIDADKLAGILASPA
jgi:threonine dehydratase